MEFLYLSYLGDLVGLGNEWGLMFVPELFPERIQGDHFQQLFAETGSKELAKGNTRKSGEFFQAGKAIYQRLPALAREAIHARIHGLIGSHSLP